MCPVYNYESKQSKGEQWDSISDNDSFRDNIKRVRFDTPYNPTEETRTSSSKRGDLEDTHFILILKGFEFISPSTIICNFITIDNTHLFQMGTGINCVVLRTHSCWISLVTTVFYTPTTGTETLVKRWKLLTFYSQLSLHSGVLSKLVPSPSTHIILRDSP